MPEPGKIVVQPGGKAVLFSANGDWIAEFISESVAREFADRAAAVRAPLENELASTKDILDELHGHVAQMCQHFGDKLEDVPCDAWRLRDHVARAVKRIASLEAQLASAPRWIPVEERLPERGAWVLVTNRSGHVQRVAWRLLETGWWECDLEEYDCVPPGEVSHWQALPESPAAAQKEPHGR